MSYDIPVANTAFIGNEKKYVDDCMESGWISSAGKYVELFENNFAEFCNVRHAIACCNGTVALHLALLALGVQTGDEVIIPTLTFVATPNSVTYCGAKPVFVDSESETWNLDPKQVEAKITPRTKGIIAVHLYGHPARMNELQDIAQRHNLFLLEDAAEAHGAICNEKVVGSIGNAAAFSFYANKIITTGEGGMVVTDDEELAARARLLRGQGMDLNRRYWHPIIGYNYRMMNLPAAIGLAQLEKIQQQIELRKNIAELYRERLGEMPGIIFQPEQVWAKHVYWMFSIVLQTEFWQNRDAVIEILAEQGIETRPLFYPAHSMPPYIDSVSGETFPVAENLSRNGLSLPTWAGLTESQIDFVCDNLKKCRK
ncbi:MAG: DegT/DnrJ/EryC1/StrS family aminotransferase [Acidobacteriota bacterium]|jgi:perosamine synthetase|nr:DegT/DnrJ/EryC1/StrS family aminotransferase [Acidobacteriota bacterium]